LKLLLVECKVFSHEDFTMNLRKGLMENITPEMLHMQDQLKVNYSSSYQNIKKNALATSCYTAVFHGI